MPNARAIRFDGTRRPLWRRALRVVLRLGVTACLTVSVASAVFWWRGRTTADQLHYLGDESAVTLTSISDRLIIQRRPSPRAGVEDGALLPRWMTEEMPVRGGLVDGWQPGPGKLLGVGWGRGTYDDAQAGGAVGGGLWWVRIKWMTLAFVTAIPPLLWALREGRRARRAELEAAGLCGRCGGAAGACDCPA